MTSKRSIATWSLALLMLPLLLFAEHFNPLGNSVDAGEIRWGDSTIYDDARVWAINQWNSLDPINILQDTSATIEDLRWKDYDDCASAFNGYYRKGTLVYSYIYLNKCKLKNLTTFKKRAVAAHELGHALGLGDHRPSDVIGLGLLMYECSTCSGVNVPQQHDKDDYKILWD